MGVKDSIRVFGKSWEKKQQGEDADRPVRQRRGTIDILSATSHSMKKRGADMLGKNISAPLKNHLRT